MNQGKPALIFKKFKPSFWIIVVIPTVLSILYFGLIASDRYVSVSNFVVRSPQKSTSVSGLSAFLQNVGFSRSTDDSYVVNDYVLSRDAMQSLEQDVGLRSKYGNSKVDLFSRFNPIHFGDGNSSENLYEYYKDKVTISLDSSSSISTLNVRAYTADDAFAINERLLELAENLVNKLNGRARQDMINTAQDNVKQAEERVQEISLQLAQYRGANLIFDVDKQAQLQMQLISKLQDQLILVETQLAQVRAVTPRNPQIRVLEQREKTIRQEIDRETQKTLGSGSNSLNQKSVEYEKLMLEKDFSTKQLASALVTLEQNKQEAGKQQLYLERISQPQKPDSALEPSRIKNILATILLSFLIWGVFRMFVAAVKEHNG